MAKVNPAASYRSWEADIGAAWNIVSWSGDGWLASVQVHIAWLLQLDATWLPGSLCVTVVWGDATMPD